MVMSKLMVYGVFDDFWTFIFSTFSIFHFFGFGAPDVPLLRLCTMLDERCDIVGKAGA